MILIIAHASDSGAAQIASNLASALGSAAVQVVRPEMLSLARWSHQVDRRGRASTTIALRPGAKSLKDAAISAVFNRISYLPAARFSRASSKDRDYAGAEMHALVTSWLAGFGERAIHSLRKHPWVTPWLPLQRWASVAANCGLPVGKRTLGTLSRGYDLAALAPDSNIRAQAAVPGNGPREVGSVLVCGGEATGRLAPRFGLQALKAAEALGHRLLEFRFAIESGRMALSEVNPIPSLTGDWEARSVTNFLISVARESAP